MTTSKMNRCRFLLLLALILLGGIFAFNFKFPSRPAAYAVSGKPTPWNLHALLQESWDFYKGRFLVDGQHVVSNTYGGTISEGQSYALLKSLWMNDPQTFRRVWTWTKLHMKRPNDHLLGWRWGDGQFGTRLGLMESENAADADQDIAYALLLAGEKWHEPIYTEDGLNIVKDLWRLNVQRVAGKYYLVPGTWEGFRQEYLSLDPSYMAPYVYRQFARFDAEHAAGWNQLADDTYGTLEACTALTKPQLPPNWCAVTWQTKPGHHSRIIFSDRQGAGSRDFSYDAFRVYWRMAMDSKLSPSPGRERALSYLKNHPFLLNYWQSHHVMPEGFTANGKPRGTETSGFAMGPVLVLNHVLPPTAGHVPDGELYHQTLAPHYHAEGYWFNDYNDFLHSVIWLHLYALSL
jgi:endo-1,4-beta-D-glucanase Y